MTQPPRIVVLGSGYASIPAILKLQRKIRPQEAELTLINRHDYHYFTTQLHKPAAGTGHPDHSRVNIRGLVDLNKVSFLKRTVTRINTAEKTVQTDDGVVPYDYLIVGLGGQPETFGIPGLMENAFCIRSINSVRMIRAHIEYQFAQYKLHEDKPEHLTFVVGGAGLTGIEFIGELVNRIPTLCKAYDVDPRLVTIYNVEAAPSALPGFDPGLVDYAMDLLKRRGVIFKMGTLVKECTSEGVMLGDGEFIRSKTVIWAGGVRGSQVLEDSGFAVSRGRVVVNPYLQAPGHENVFIIGDCSIVMDEEGRPYPPSAQISIQQGETAARNVIALLRKQEPSPFVYIYRGTIASLGKGEGIGRAGKFKLTGIRAAILKKIVDCRYLYKIGGLGLLIRKSASFL